MSEQIQTQNESVGTRESLIALTKSLWRATLQASVSNSEHSDAGSARDFMREGERHIAFLLDGVTYCAPIDNVVEAGNAPPVTSLPGVPAWLHGITNWRGDIVSVVDLRAFFSSLNEEQRMKRNDEHHNAQMLVVRSLNAEKDSSDESMTTCLLIDKIVGVRYVVAKNVNEEMRAMTVSQFARGSYEHDGRTLFVLDIERLLHAPEIRQFETMSV
ncbi:MAG: hypothetical protein NVSMB56_04890 [Pyrinomonadaceae bacterium]